MKDLKTALWMTVLTTASAAACAPATTRPDVANSDASADSADSASCDNAIAADGGICYRIRRCDGQRFCPAQITNSQTQPTFLVTYINLSTPAALARPSPIADLLNTGLADGSARWGISLNLTSAAEGTIRTGALQQGAQPMPGLGFFRSEFRYMDNMAPGPRATNRWDPVSGTVSLADEAFTTSTVALLTIPIFTAATGELLAELPLRNASLHGARFTAMRNCIGLANPQFNSCLSNGVWNTTDATNAPYGVIEADLTVEDARNVAIPMFNTDLCRIISSAMPDCNTDPAGWPAPPDTTVGDSPVRNAWHIRGAFSAVAVVIR